MSTYKRDWLLGVSVRASVRALVNQCECLWVCTPHYLRLHNNKFRKVLKVFIYFASLSARHANIKPKRRKIIKLMKAAPSWGRAGKKTEINSVATHLAAWRFPKMFSFTFTENFSCAVSFVFAFAGSENVFSLFLAFILWFMPDI